MSRKISFSDLVEQVVGETGKPKRTIHNLLKEMITECKKGLLRDGRVNIAGLGVSELRWRDKRNGINPQNGTPIKIRAHNAVHFKPEASLRRFINQEYEDQKPEIISNASEPDTAISEAKPETDSAEILDKPTGAPEIIALGSASDTSTSNIANDSKPIEPETISVNETSEPEISEGPTEKPEAIPDDTVSEASISDTKEDPESIEPETNVADEPSLAESEITQPEISGTPIVESEIIPDPAESDASISNVMDNAEPIESETIATDEASPAKPEMGDFEILDKPITFPPSEDKTVLSDEAQNLDEQNANVSSPDEPAIPDKEDPSVPADEETIAPTVHETSDKSSLGSRRSLYKIIGLAIGVLALLSFITTGIVSFFNSSKEEAVPVQVAEKKKETPDMAPVQANIENPAAKESSSPALIDKPEILHEIKRGDRLWTISKSQLASPYLWPYIFRANLKTVKNPDILKLGEVINIPQLEGTVTKLSEKDVSEIAEGYLHAYFAYNRIYKRKSRFYLWVAQQWGTPELLDRFRDDIRNEDWEYCARIKGSSKIKKFVRS